MSITTHESNGQSQNAAAKALTLEVQISGRGQ